MQKSYTELDNFTEKKLLLMLTTMHDRTSLNGCEIFSWSVSCHAPTFASHKIPWGLLATALPTGVSLCVRLRGTTRYQIFFCSFDHCSDIIEVIHCSKSHLSNIKFTYTINVTLRKYVNS